MKPNQSVKKKYVEPFIPKRTTTIECFVNGWHECGSFPCSCAPERGWTVCRWHRKVRVLREPYVRDQSPAPPSEQAEEKS